MATNPTTKKSADRLNLAVQTVTNATQELVATRTKAAYSELDLTPEELNRAHEFFIHNNQISPTEFWSNTAVLRSSLLSRTVIAIVNESSKRITDQLATVLSTSQDSEASEAFATTVAASNDGIAVTELTPIQTLTHCLDTIYRPVLDYSEIDRVGELWQTQLSSEARRIAQQSISNGAQNEFGLAVQLAETTLMVETPWIYTDRLLSAFELAHKKIHKHTHQTKDALVTVFEKLL